MSWKPAIEIGEAPGRILEIAIEYMEGALRRGVEVLNSQRVDREVCIVMATDQGERYLVQTFIKRRGRCRFRYGEMD